ncbi:MAG: hypothetical protein ACFE8G_12465, partial [Candidatus Hermodarchaeota archaeon]
MEDLKALITNLVDIFSGDIREFYKIYESYLIDLIISKKIDISLIIDQIEQKEAKDNLYSIIAATNSAFLTIGVSKSELMADNELYKESYEKNKSMFNTYLSFLQLGLKDYINKLLFNIILDYLINNKNKLIENLDLFDLLPYEFRNKLSRFRNKSNISGKIKKQFTNFKNDLFQYFDPSNLIFKVEDFQSDQLGETISEKEMLEKLEEARQDNIKAIKLTSNHINNELLLSDGEIPSLLSYFENFSKLNYSVIDKIVINLKQIRKFITSSPDFLDLENLFYAVNIFKMFGEELLLEVGYVENVVKNFISGKVF